MSAAMSSCARAANGGAPRRRAPSALSPRLSWSPSWSSAPSSASQIAPESPFTQRLLVGDQPPSAEFLAGTDLLGRDVLSRVIHGARTALVGPIVVAVGAFAIATLLGLLSGYLGGVVDTADHALGRLHAGAARRR